MTLTGDVICDAFGWGVLTWSRCIPFWEGSIGRDFTGRSALELGAGFNGGLALYMAKRGAQVTCGGWHPDFSDVSDIAKALHKRHGMQDRIEYSRMSARELEQEGGWDIIAYK